MPATFFVPAASLAPIGGGSASTFGFCLCRVDGAGAPRFFRIAELTIAVDLAVH